MVRYSLLRLMIFFGLLIVFWLVGMRGFLLLGVSAVVSMAVSLLLLQGPRAEFSAKIAARVDERARRAATAAHVDEDSEDAEAAAAAATEDAPATATDKPRDSTNPEPRRAS